MVDDKGTHSTPALAAGELQDLRQLGTDAASESARLQEELMQQQAGLQRQLEQLDQALAAGEQVSGTLSV